MSIRVRSFHTDDERRDIVSRFLQSGATSGQFAPAAGVSAYTLRSWRRRFAPDPLRSSRSVRAPVRPAFVEAFDCSARDVIAAGTHPMEIALPRGITLRLGRGADPAEIRRIVDALVA